MKISNFVVVVNCYGEYLMLEASNTVAELNVQTQSLFTRNVSTDVTYQGCLILKV